MTAERITSRANPLIAHIRKLSSSRSYRRETGEFLGDGVKLLAEAVRWGAPLTAVVHTADAQIPDLPAGVRRVEVPEALMETVSPMQAPQGALFLARMPARTAPAGLEQGRYLALEGVQDPGNVGTILRTAGAFGARGLLLLPGCADPYSHKTVRASMGALFRVPVWECGLEELGALAEAAALPLVGTALRPDTADVREAALGRGVFLIGSEGRGLSAQALAACGRTVRIPMDPGCESLNAAVAAAILLWEGCRGDRQRGDGHAVRGEEDIWQH